MVCVILFALDEDRGADVRVSKGGEVAEPLPAIVVGVGASLVDDSSPQLDALLHLILDRRRVDISRPRDEVLQPSCISESLHLGRRALLQEITRKEVEVHDHSLSSSTASTEHDLFSRFILSISSCGVCFFVLGLTSVADERP